MELLYCINDNTRSRSPRLGVLWWRQVSDMDTTGFGSHFIRIILLKLDIKSKLDVPEIQWAINPNLVSLSPVLFSLRGNP